jgi:hypothetical protein
MRATQTRVAEMRFSPRFPITADVVFRWFEKEKEGLQHGCGVTQDISKTGVHMIGEVIPQPGTPISLQIVMPPVSEGGRTFLLESKGVVVWTSVSAEGGMSDFGAVVEHGLFVEKQDHEIEQVYDGC